MTIKFSKSQAFQRCSLRRHYVACVLKRPSAPGQSSTGATLDRSLSVGSFHVKQHARERVDQTGVSQLAPVDKNSIRIVLRRPVPQRPLRAATQPCRASALRALGGRCDPQDTMDTRETKRLTDPELHALFDRLTPGHFVALVRSWTSTSRATRRIGGRAVTCGSTWEQSGFPDAPT